MLQKPPKNRSNIEGKTDIIGDSVKKCSRIITGKFIKIQKCGHRECTNCQKYIDKDHKCYMERIKAKVGNCTIDRDKTWKSNGSIKKKDWCYSCRTYTDEYMFYDFEATQNTGTRTINLTVLQDFNGMEYILNTQ